MTTNTRDPRPPAPPRLPSWIIWGSAAAFVALWYLQWRTLALASFFIPFLGWRLYRRSKTYRAKEQAFREWEAAQRDPDDAAP